MTAAWPFNEIAPLSCDAPATAGGGFQMRNVLRI
mgnify:CR=1 FL=1